jgi:hypothetical protein
MQQYWSNRDNCPIHFAFGSKRWINISYRVVWGLQSRNNIFLGFCFVCLFFLIINLGICIAPKPALPGGSRYCEQSVLPGLHGRQTNSTRSAHVQPPLAVNSKSERKVNSLPPLGFELVIIGMLAHLSNHSTKSHSHINNKSVLKCLRLLSVYDIYLRGARLEKTDRIRKLKLWSVVGFLAHLSQYLLVFFKVKRTQRWLIIRLPRKRLCKARLSRERLCVPRLPWQRLRVAWFLA